MNIIPPVSFSIATGRARSVFSSGVLMMDNSSSLISSSLNPSAGNSSCTTPRDSIVDFLGSVVVLSFFVDFLAS